MSAFERPREGKGPVPESETGTVSAVDGRRVTLRGAAGEIEADVDEWTAGLPAVGDVCLLQGLRADSERRATARLGASPRARDAVAVRGAWVRVAPARSGDENASRTLTWARPDRSTSVAGSEECMRQAEAALARADAFGAPGCIVRGEAPDGDGVALPIRLGAGETPKEAVQRVARSDALVVEGVERPISGRRFLEAVDKIRGAAWEVIPTDALSLEASAKRRDASGQDECPSAPYYGGENVSTPGFKSSAMILVRDGDRMTVAAVSPDGAEPTPRRLTKLPGESIGRSAAVAPDFQVASRETESAREKAAPPKKASTDPAASPEDRRAFEAWLRDDKNWGAKTAQGEASRVFVKSRKRLEREGIELGRVGEYLDRAVEVATRDETSKQGASKIRRALELYVDWLEFAPNETAADEDNPGTDPQARLAQAAAALEEEAEAEADPTEGRSLSRQRPASGGARPKRTAPAADDLDLSEIDGLDPDDIRDADEFPAFAP